LTDQKKKKKHNGKTESIHTLQWKEEGERLCVLVPSWTSVTASRELPERVYCISWLCCHCNKSSFAERNLYYSW